MSVGCHTWQYNFLSIQFYCNSILISVTDNTAVILARRSTFSRHDRMQYHLPVVIRDNGSPILSSTNTLTIIVCMCQPAGHCPSGDVKAQVSMDVSILTALSVAVCIIALVGKEIQIMLHYLLVNEK